MNLDFQIDKFQKKFEKAIIYKNRIDNYVGTTLVNKDTEKIGFFISSFLHFSLIFIAIGIPSCFQPKIINIPNIIPIEILNVDEVTNIPVETKKNNENIEQQNTKTKEVTNIPVETKKNNENIEQKNTKTKEVKFTSSDQTEIAKIQDVIQDEAPIEEKIDVPPKQIPEKVKIKVKPKIKEETPEEKFESIPTKKIKPKIKPKPQIKQKEISDVVIKIKPKPKQNFNISSVLKDLRKEEMQINKMENIDEKNIIEKEESGKKNSQNFTISEIDLLKQQLYSCWTVPAGTKGASDMVVKIRVWVNPDRTVNNARILDTNQMQNDPYFRTVAESALRAVLNPACSPLKLPLEKYEVWKKFIFKFELGWMLGN